MRNACWWRSELGLRCIISKGKRKRQLNFLAGRYVHTWSDGTGSHRR